MSVTIGTSGTYTPTTGTSNGTQVIYDGTR